jgi:hypothetical protein
MAKKSGGAYKPYTAYVSRDNDAELLEFLEEWKFKYPQLARLASSDSGLIKLALYALMDKVEKLGQAGESQGGVQAAGEGEFIKLVASEVVRQLGPVLEARLMSALSGLSIQPGGNQDEDEDSDDPLDELGGDLWLE